MNIGEQIKTSNVVFSVSEIYVSVRDVINKMDSIPSTKRMSDLTWRIVNETINIREINEIR